MCKLVEIESAKVEEITLPSMGWLQEVVGLRKGGIYLLAGEPGIGKTTMAVKILGDISAQGIRCLYLTNEQSKGDISLAAQRLLGSNGHISETIGNNFEVEHLRKIEDLRFWREHIFEPNQQYSGTSVIVIDSVQGGGTAATSKRAYSDLYSFTAAAKNHGIIVILIGHITKDGKIAGPKDLEHEVDVVIYVRRAFNLRPLFVPKNRFGPARMDPFVMIMDKKGNLMPSPHSAPSNSIVYGAGVDYEAGGGSVVEIQANVALAKYGEKARVRAPYLPTKKVTQLLDVLSRLPDIDVASLSFDINCYVRGGRSYHMGLDLPLVVGVVSSYLKQEPPKNALFIGEIDLNGNIRAPPKKAIDWITQLFQNDGEGSRIGLKKLYISSEVGNDLEESLIIGGANVEIVRVANLSDLFGQLWPESYNG